jgi:hypothetical protein
VNAAFVMAITSQGDHPR